MVVLETIKLALELAKAGVELGKEIYKVAKTVHADVAKARELRRSKDKDSRAAKEYAAAKAQLKPVARSPRSPTVAAVRNAEAEGVDPNWPPKETLQGTMVLKTLGITMAGTFVDGELEGQGVFQNASVRYDGEFVNGEFEGVGRIQYLKRGSTYTGQFLGGVPNGAGKLVTKKGSEYVCRFESGSPVEGVIVTPSGIMFEGTIEGWQPKFGTATYPSGMVYQGQLKDWSWHGQGLLLYPPRNKKTGKEYKALSYRGDFDMCKFSGNGEMKWRKGYKWKGVWKDNTMVETTGKMCKFDLKDPEQLEKLAPQPSLSPVSPSGRNVSPLVPAATAAATQEVVPKRESSDVGSGGGGGAAVP
eukprot:INCI3825.1.p1 GENE.INCI3825.1~~INCI3825.1.p1  ORF type:complete len:359 (+),score=71.15 INCI3825.1:109-1185(+)